MEMRRAMSDNEHLDKFARLYLTLALYVVLVGLIFHLYGIW